MTEATLMLPVPLKHIQLRNDGFSWAHLSAQTDTDLAQILRDLTYMAYPVRAEATMYISLPHPSGLAKFYIQTQDKTGFGGARFELAAYGGGVYHLHGPWSSREGVVNMITNRKLVDIAINGLSVSMDANELQPQLHAADPTWTLERETDHEREISYHLPVSLAPPRTRG